MSPRIIFVTGGVVSSLGKGIVASIIGGLLHSCGIRIRIKKLDPYLNVDSGTLSPIEHGEVFVTADGAETDLDLGHYERLGKVQTCKVDYVTSGAVYYNILTKERRGDYLGKTITVIPHVTQGFEKAILAGSEDVDVLICEIGGTVGDIESEPILETARQIKQKNYDKVMFVHVALLPFLNKVQEWKTKPIQHSIRTLLSYGIQPDLLLCRMERPNYEDWKQKLAMMCNIKLENILAALDAPSIYHAMINYANEGIAKRISDIFDMKIGDCNIDYVKRYVAKLDSPLPKVKIAIVGKYTVAKDAYKSLDEALHHAAAAVDRHVEIEWIDAENYDVERLKHCDGIIVPGGFGNRGVSGKLAAIKFAREYDKPYFGICFGMQLMVIDGLSQILQDVSSSEFGKCENPVIAKLEEWITTSGVQKAGEFMGGTMRLGAYECSIEPGTLAHRIYGIDSVKERHRHRYEVNNAYLRYFDEVNLRVSGVCKQQFANLVEIVEGTKNRFFVGVQFHPELQSNIEQVSPLFKAFLQACIGDFNK